MATLQSNKAKAGVQPRLVHTGSQSVKFVYSVTASLSAGDVIQTVKVPHGAIMEDVKLVRTGAGQFTCNIGDGGLPNRFRLSATLVANTIISGISVAGGLAYQYDLSDDAAPQYDTIDLLVTTVTTAIAGGVITGIIRYHCDEADP